eukprot:Awhi_evm1s1576
MVDIEAPSINRVESVLNVSEFQAKLSWFHFSIVLFIVGLINIPFIIAIGTLRSTSLQDDLFYLKKEQTLLTIAFGQYTADPTSQNPVELLDKKTSLEGYKEELVKDLDLAFILYLVSYALNFLASLCVLVVTFLKRGERA